MSNDTRALRFERTMSDAEALMWTIEKDPWMNPSGAMVSLLGFQRDQAREIVGEGFVEIFCDAPLEFCEQRDEDGLYERARAGDIGNVTGIDAPYEPPKSPDIVLDTSGESLEANVLKVLDLLTQRGLLES